MWRKPSNIYGSVETLTEDLGTVQEPRVTLGKVRKSINDVPLTCLNIFNSVFVCVATLAILDRLEEVDEQTLGWWLAERQLPNGGLNGRPEKLEDVRYS